jgi:SRSO17 transposase
LTFEENWALLFMNYNKQESPMISTKRVLDYPMLLLLSNPLKKTAEALAPLLNISGDTLLRILEHECVTFEELLKLAKKLFGMKKIYLVIDDTIIRKSYSHYINGSSDNYDPVDKKVHRSICTVVALITDGKRALPIAHKLAISKEFTPTGKHKTKIEIAQELIEMLIGKIDIKMVLMDGLYASEDMIKWLKRKSLPFEMRFHSNRVVGLSEDNHDTTVKIKEYEGLKLKGKKSCRTIKAFWKGESVYITAVERYEKDGSKRIVYQISNVETLARNHAKAYDQRWHVEKFFRTSKQYLGLTHCQSRKRSLQENHIYNVFLAYAILQFERQKHKFKNIEQALHNIKRKKNIPIYTHLQRAGQIFRSNEVTYA